jgi:RNA polymerase sigma-70 factor (ECF subfamily)
MKHLSDAEIVQLWVTGDSDAGEELLGRYFDPLRCFLVNAVPDQDCADVLQDVFARVLEAKQRFANHSSFRTYLFAIARYAVADHYREKYRAEKHFDPATQSVEDLDGLRPSTADDQLRRGRRLNACLRKLSIHERELIELHYWHDFDQGELSEIFGVPRETIRTRLYRARNRLGALLQACVEEAEHDDVVTELEGDLRALGRELGEREPTD